MRKILLFIIVLLFCTSCLYKEIKEELNKDSKNNFTRIAEKLISNKKYSLLYRICKSKLDTNPNNYIAAYYRALIIQKINKITGIDYYLEFIRYNPDMPDEYKEKWLEIADNIFESKKIKYSKFGVNFSPNKISLLDDENGGQNYTATKVLEDNNNYYYLNDRGVLFSIKKESKMVKKINSYKTKDFILLENYLIFSDSVNLIKYDTLTDKYDLFYSFQKDDIKFISSNHNTLSCVISHLEGDTYLLKHINFNTKKITNLPDNCIAQSQDYKYLIMNYSNYFEVFNFAGKKLSSIDGKFLGFGRDSNEIFYFSNNYIYQNTINYNLIKKIIFIPDYKKNKAFKIVNNNKLFFCFDNYMLVYFLYAERAFLIKGNLEHSFRNGFMFTKENESDLFFFSFFDNSANLLFKDKNILNNIIFSNNDSSIFFVRNENDMNIYELLNFFP